MTGPRTATISFYVLVSICLSAANGESDAVVMNVRQYCCLPLYQNQLLTGPLLVLQLAQQEQQEAFSNHYETIMALHISTLQQMQHHSSKHRSLQHSKSNSRSAACSSSMQQLTHNQSRISVTMLVLRLPPTQLLLWLQH